MKYLKQIRFLILIIPFVILMRSEKAHSETIVKARYPLTVDPILRADSAVVPPPIDIPPKKTTILFTGDMNLGRCVAETTIRSGSFDYPFKYVAEKLNAADITVGSLDGSLSDESKYQSCPDSMNLIGPENMVQGLVSSGFDLITIATNHSKDCGDLGFSCDNKSFFDTIGTLSAAGIQPVGGGENITAARQPVLMEKNGVRFAFLAVDQVNERVWATETVPGVAPISEEYLDQVKADIASAKTIADVVIVLPQWGTEYSPTPDDYQRRWAQEFISAGATLVVGNGPHIIQSTEAFQNGMAFYALGNFVFDQGQNHRREGVVLQASFNGSTLTEWELLPLNINYYTYQPQWVNGEEAQKILSRTKGLSQ